MKIFSNGMTSAMFAALMTLAIQQGAARAVEHAAQSAATTSELNMSVLPQANGPTHAWCYDPYWGWYQCGY